MEIIENEKTEIENLIKTKIEEASKRFGKDCKILIIEILSLEKMLQPNNTKPKEDLIIPLVKWNDYYPDPSIKALRMLVFNKDNNGFEEMGVIERRGKRILINERKYFEWRKKYGKV